MFGCLETPERWRQRVRREPQLIARLRLATTRLADADREQISDHGPANSSGSVHPSDGACHRLESHPCPSAAQGGGGRPMSVWLSQVHDDGCSLHASRPGGGPARSAAPHPDTPGRGGGSPPLVPRVAGAVGACGPCGREPAPRERGGDGVRAVLLARSGGCVPGWRRTSTNSPAAPLRTLKSGQQVGRSFGLRHRQRLAEPEPQPRRLSPQEARAAVRPAKRLPPYERH